MSQISPKFLDAIRNGRTFNVRYRWGETFRGSIDWTDWEEGALAFMEKSNPSNEPGITIAQEQETGWGFAGREKEMEKVFGETIFGRFVDGPNEHLVQVEFLDD